MKYELYLGLFDRNGKLAGGLWLVLIVGPAYRSNLRIFTRVMYVCGVGCFVCCANLTINRQKRMIWNKKLKNEKKRMIWNKNEKKRMIWNKKREKNAWYGTRNDKKRMIWNKKREKHMIWNAFLYTHRMEWNIIHYVYCISFSNHFYLPTYCTLQWTVSMDHHGKNMYVRVFIPKGQLL